MQNSYYKGLRLVRWLSVAAMVLSVVVFLATHDPPGSSPGGFGQGHKNLFDILRIYGPVVAIAMIVFAITSVLMWWLRRDISD